MENFEYFEKGSGNNIDKLIKEYGHDVCRNIIDKHYINLQTKNYDFGFIHKLPIANIGQRRNNKPNDFVYSFILCNLYPQFDEIDITLVCSRHNSKDGKKLIELVCSKGRELNYKHLSLLSICETKLVNWYKSQDFVLVSEKYFPNGDLKAYSMRKKL